MAQPSTNEKRYLSVSLPCTFACTRRHGSLPPACDCLADSFSGVADLSLARGSSALYFRLLRLFASVLPLTAIWLSPPLPFPRPLDSISRLSMVTMLVSASVYSRVMCVRANLSYLFSASAFSVPLVPLIHSTTTSAKLLTANCYLDSSTYMNCN